MFFKIIIGIFIFVVCFLAFKSFITRHDQLKSENQRQLTACPDKPNCVFSRSTIKREKIKPFTINKQNPEASWQALRQAIEETNGVIIADDGHYLHATYTSFVFRFKDDVEAVLTPEQIDIRSASRAGTSDLGKNRKRVEEIHSLYNAKQP